MNTRYPFLLLKFHLTDVKMAVEQVQMLREISHDIKTPKKRDTMESSNDFFERLAGDDDRNINEIESYEVITEYR